MSRSINNQQTHYSFQIGKRRFSGIGSTAFNAQYQDNSFTGIEFLEPGYTLPDFAKYHILKDMRNNASVFCVPAEFIDFKTCRYLIENREIRSKHNRMMFNLTSEKRNNANAVSILCQYRFNSKNVPHLSSVNITGPIQFSQKEKNDFFELLKKQKHLTNMKNVKLPKDFLSPAQIAELEQVIEKNHRRETLKEDVRKERWGQEPDSYRRRYVLLGALLGGIACLIGLTAFSFYTSALVTAFGGANVLAFGAMAVGAMGAFCFATVRQRYLGWMASGCNVKNPEPEVREALKCGEEASRSVLTYFSHYLNKNTYKNYSAYCAGLHAGIGDDRKTVARIRIL